MLTALVLVLATTVHAAERDCGAMPYLQRDGHACGGSYMTSGSFCVPKTPQSAPTIFKPSNAQCPSGWFSSGAYACEKF